MTSLGASFKPALGSCGCGVSTPFDGATPEYRRVLGWVIAINLIGFVVVGVGAVVWLTHSRWPDLIAGGFLAAVFLQSAWSITVQALDERRNALATAH